MVKVRVFLVSIVLAGAAFVSSFGPAQAAGFCFNATGASDKVFVDKDSSELGAGTFDLVRGDAYVSAMNPCVGTAAFPYAQGSWILLANMEDTDGAGNDIMQAGYGKGCSLCADDFIYTPAAHGAGVAWPGSLTPIYGHRVRFVIKRTGVSGSYSAKYVLTDVTTGESENDVATWDGGNTKTWWGAEALDTSSEVGVDATSQDDNMAYMGYSTTQSGTIFYRSGMIFDSCYCETSPGGGPSDIEKQNGTNSAEHGHLGSWVYGNDMVNFESH